LYKLSLLSIKKIDQSQFEHYVFGNDDLIPDVIPDEKKPLEPPEGIEDDEFDDDEEEVSFYLKR